MKASQFFKGLSWLLLLNLLVKPVWIFGIDRQLQNEIGFEEYGSYFSILSLSVVLLFIADAGLTNMLNRQLAVQQQSSVGQLVGYKCILSLVYLSVLFFIGWLTHIRRWEIIMLVGGIQVLTSMLVFFRNIITGHQLFATDAWLSIVDKGLMIVLCGFYLYAPFSTGLTLLQFLYFQLGSTAMALVVAVLLISRKVLPAKDKHRVSEIFRMTLPFTLLVLLMAVHSRLDAFLLERIHPNGAYEAGVYAAAYRVLDAGNMLGYLAASFLVPFAARHLKDGELLQTTVLGLRHGLLLIATVTVAIVSVFAKPIIELFYYAPDHYTAKVLAYCIAALPAYYLIHIYGSLLTAKGLFRQFITIMLLGVVLNVLLNVLLIPDYGAWGCCIAALISQYSCGILCTVAASRSLLVPYHWRSLAGYVLAGGAVFFVCYFLSHYHIP
ncbi:MAG: hypothetical protein JWP69_1130 [Flaviaesturariibacter sp.]|nr:hypothetical protein [Flaviaesturariibacter sp.]